MSGGGRRRPSFCAKTKLPKKRMIEDDQVRFGWSKGSLNSSRCARDKRNKRVKVQRGTFISFYCLDQYAQTRGF